MFRLRVTHVPRISLFFGVAVYNGKFQAEAVRIATSPGTPYFGSRKSHIGCHLKHLVSDICRQVVEHCRRVSELALCPPGETIVY